MSLFYGAAGCLVAAQIVGVYALKTRKADLIFSLFMVALVLASIMLGYVGARDQLGV